MTEQVCIRYAITVVRGCDFDRTLKAAADGDEKAQDFCLALLEWNTQVSQSEAKPACFSCDEIITRNNFGGLGFAKPTSSDNETATTGAFCLQCQRKGWEKLVNEFSERMADALGVVMAPLQ